MFFLCSPATWLWVHRRCLSLYHCQFAIVLRFIDGYPFSQPPFGHCDDVTSPLDVIFTVKQFPQMGYPHLVSDFKAKSVIFFFCRFFLFCDVISVLCLHRWRWLQHWFYVLLCMLLQLILFRHLGRPHFGTAMEGVVVAVHDVIQMFQMILEEFGYSVFHCSIETFRKNCLGHSLWMTLWMVHMYVTDFTFATRSTLLTNNTFGHVVEGLSPFHMHIN